MTRKSDLWYTEVTVHGLGMMTQYFILDVSNMPEGELDEAHAVMAALEIVCAEDTMRPSFMTTPKLYEVKVHGIRKGNREEFCSASASLKDGHFVDHMGDRVRRRDDRVSMFRVGDPI